MLFLVSLGAGVAFYKNRFINMDIVLYKKSNKWYYVLLKNAGTYNCCVYYDSLTDFFYFYDSNRIQQTSAVVIICLFIGVPVVFSLGFSSIVYLIVHDIPLVIAAQKIYSGVDVFVLLSISIFLLTGNLMSKNSTTDKIIAFSNFMVGHIRGGLGLANIITSMIFAGISGTAIADISSLGNVLIPSMKKEGYSARFSVGVTDASSTIGHIIPPSLPMIIVSTLSGLSAGKLFIADAVPGILLGAGLLILSYRYVSVRISS